MGKTKVNRKRLFDRRRYKHIGWFLADNPEVELDVDSVDGIGLALKLCMVHPFMKFDERKGVFLYAEFYDSIFERACVMAVYTLYRYPGGFVEDSEHYAIPPSIHFLEEIDDVVETEWNDLLKRSQEFHPSNGS